MRTVATFQSTDFNTTEEREYFINPCCFGDDLAKWLMARLKERGVQTDAEPGQEDFGWYFNFAVPEGKHCCVLGFRPEDEGEEGTWVAWLERRCGFLGSVFGGRRRGIAGSAVQAIHTTLASAPEIRNLRWHVKEDFDRGREEMGSADPGA